MYDEKVKEHLINALQVAGKATHPDEYLKEEGAASRQYRREVDELLKVTPYLPSVRRRSSLYFEYEDVQSLAFMQVRAKLPQFESWYEKKCGINIFSASAEEVRKKYTLWYNTIFKRKEIDLIRQKNLRDYIRIDGRLVKIESLEGPASSSGEDNRTIGETFAPSTLEGLDKWAQEEQEQADRAFIQAVFEYVTKPADERLLRSPKSYPDYTHQILVLKRFLEQPPKTWKDMNLDKKVDAKKYNAVNDFFDKRTKPFFKEIVGVIADNMGYKRY
jgi:hypothetical protein